MDIDKYLTDAEVYDLFIQNINDEVFYFDEEGFIEFLDALYNEGQITKERYNRRRNCEQRQTARLPAETGGGEGG